MLNRYSIIQLHNATLLTLQAFSSQKSLPGRPELEKVKVNCAHKRMTVYFNVLFVLGIFPNSIIIFVSLLHGLCVFQECPDGSEAAMSSTEELK